MAKRVVQGILTVGLMTVGLGVGAAGAQAQDITNGVIDAFLKGFSAENTELEKVGPQLAEIDEKIKKWTECKTAFEAAAQASGSKLGGMAAGIAMRAKCGASNDEGFRKDKAKILAGPEKAASSS
jgi:hypothetical protein